RGRRLFGHRQLGADRDPVEDQRHRPPSRARSHSLARRRDDSGGSTMNKPLRNIAIFCGLLIVALLIRDNWLQFVQADELKNDPDNRRVAIERYAQPRGNIIVDGKPVTGSTESKATDF